MTLRPGRPATPPDAEENAELRRRLSQELPAVRTAATQWRAGLLAILAATLGVGAFKGRETVATLSTGYGVTFGVLMGLCGLLAAGGVLACSYAAYGLPIWRARRSGLTVLDADEAHRAEPISHHRDRHGPAGHRAARRRHRRVLVRPGIADGGRRHCDAVVGGPRLR